MIGSVPLRRFDPLVHAFLYPNQKLARKNVAARPARRPLPEHLPREEVLHPVPTLAQSAAGPDSSDISETHVPGRFKVVPPRARKPSRAARVRASSRRLHRITRPERGGRHSDLSTGSPLLTGVGGRLSQRDNLLSDIAKARGELARQQAVEIRG